MARHIDDLELSQYAFDPDSIAPERQAEIQRHAASCDECGQRLDFYLVAEDDLHDPMVWGESSVPMPAALTAGARRCWAEDAEADVLLAPYFQNPAKAAWANLPKQREFLTGGVVRRLSARAHALLDSAPLTSLIFADLAQAIASLLPEGIYPHNAVYELRGTAWKEHANALVRLGKYDDALESLDRAEHAYRNLSLSALGLADVELARAAVFYQREKLDPAAQHAERAEHGYANLGQEPRRIKALFLRGSIKYLALDLQVAAAIFQNVIEYGEETDDPDWIARGSYARANCELDRGNLADASMLFHAALVTFRRNGHANERISTEWGLARVILQGGRADEAARRLRDVIHAFEDLGMMMDAAIAGLDLADALFALDQPKNVAKVAAHSFRVLKEAGVVTSALTALAYLEESAASDRLNQQVIQEVRTFLRRTVRDPELLFLRPQQLPG